MAFSIFTQTTIDCQCQLCNLRFLACITIITIGIVHNAFFFGIACQKPHIAQLALDIFTQTTINCQCQLCDVRFLACITIITIGIVHNAFCVVLPARNRTSHNWHFPFSLNPLLIGNANCAIYGNWHALPLSRLALFYTMPVSHVSLFCY